MFCINLINVLICSHFSIEILTFKRFRLSLAQCMGWRKYVWLCLYTSHIQRSPAKFVDRQKVAKFQIRQGVERVFPLKSTLSHFGRGSGGAL